MIWARPLCSADKADALWVRSSLTPEGVGLLRSGLEVHALVTGLDADARELLVELVGVAWVGGSGDAAVIRYSALSLEAWTQRLGRSELGLALTALWRSQQPLVAGTVGAKSFAWGERTFVMGILNVTPDSFSDGGVRSIEDVTAHAEVLIAAGADLLDVGGESTRPGASPVSEEEELRRVVPAIEALRAKVSVPISVDTRKPAVARAAIAAGATLVNDVSGLRDDAMLDVLADTGASACAMHMQGVPATMQAAPHYDDVGTEVLDALELALRRVEARGVPRSRIWVDPGFGFGKTTAHNLFLMQRAADLRLLGVPVLIGVSRKGFLGAVTGLQDPSERVLASAVAAGLLASTGAVDVVRVHDVAETRAALAIADSVRTARNGGARFGS